MFRQFEQRLTPTMCQDHVAGDKVFVDYSGRKVPIVDRDTGTVREAERFIGVPRLIVPDNLKSAMNGCCDPWPGSIC